MPKACYRRGLPHDACVGLMPLVHRNQQRLAGKQGTGAGPDEDGGGHRHGPTDDCPKDVPVRHVLIVDTQPVKDL